MEVKLSEKAAAIVAEQVANGWYGSPEEAVEAAIGLLCEDFDLDEIIERNRDAIEEGLASLDDGQFVEVTDEFFQKLRERVEARAKR